MNLKEFLDSLSPSERARFIANAKNMAVEHVKIAKELGPFHGRTCNCMDCIKERVGNIDEKNKT